MRYYNTHGYDNDNDNEYSKHNSDSYNVYEKENGTFSEVCCGTSI